MGEAQPVMQLGIVVAAGERCRQGRGGEMPELLAGVIGADAEPLRLEGSVEGDGARIGRPGGRAFAGPLQRQAEAIVPLGVVRPQRDRRPVGLDGRAETSELVEGPGAPELPAGMAVLQGTGALQRLRPFPVPFQPIERLGQEIVIVGRIRGKVDGGRKRLGRRCVVAELKQAPAALAVEHRILRAKPACLVEQGQRLAERLPPDQQESEVRQDAGILTAQAERSPVCSFGFRLRPLALVEPARGVEKVAGDPLHARLASHCPNGPGTRPPHVLPVLSVISVTDAPERQRPAQTPRVSMTTPCGFGIDLKPE